MVSCCTNDDNDDDENITKNLIYLPRYHTKNEYNIQPTQYYVFIYIYRYRNAGEH